ncbi:MAG: methyltransferase domain-containing protein [Sphingomonadales bacterium]
MARPGGGAAVGCGLIGLRPRRLVPGGSAHPALLFARQFLANPRCVGSLIPSSQPLVQRMLAGVDWSRVDTAVEFGPGTGVITRAALARLRPDARLIAFELDPRFAAYLAESIADPRLRVLTVSAEAVAAHVPAGCDVALSSLPFSIMPRDVRGRILAATAATLRPGGRCNAYQYSPALLPELRSLFGAVTMRFEPRNWPPAFVFSASV